MLEALTEQMEHDSTQVGKPRSGDQTSSTPESEVADRPVSHTHTLSRGPPSDSRLGLSNRENITSPPPVKTDSIFFEAGREQIHPEQEPGARTRKRGESLGGSTGGSLTWRLTCLTRPAMEAGA